MNTKKTVLLVVATFASAAVWASGFNFSVGPAWRSRVKMETRGTTRVPTVTPSHTPEGEDSIEYNYNPYRDGWSPADASRQFEPDGSGDEYYAIAGNYTETLVTPNSGVAALDSTDTRSPLGLKAQVGYDFLDFGAFSLGLGLRFAGYWNLRSTFSGLAGGATRQERTVTDWWYFHSGPIPTDMDLDDSWEIDEEPTTGNRSYGERQDLSPIAGQSVRGRLRADLYQIGVGPTLSWHALSWLDAYASVAALCNIAKLDLDSDSGERTSRTACRLGVGADVGLAAYVTENIGIYAEVGYEWVDGFNTSIDTLTAEIDFSSLVVSAGVVFRF